MHNFCLGVLCTLLVGSLILALRMRRRQMRKPCAPRVLTGPYKDMPPASSVAPGTTYIDETNTVYVCVLDSFLRRPSWTHPDK